MVRGRIEDPIARWVVIGARRPTLARTHQLGVSAGQVEGVNLVAAFTFRPGLEDQPGTVSGEVCLGILPREGELADVLQMDLPGIDQAFRPSFLGRHSADLEKAQESEKKRSPDKCSRVHVQSKLAR
jgi:hypothetical protein